MLMQLLVQTTLWLGLLGVILFLAAGDWHWPQAWLFLAETAVSSLAICLWLARHDRALLEQRLTSPIQHHQQPWDRVLMGLMLVAFLSWMVFLGLDAGRFRWWPIPSWGQMVGAVSIVLAMVLVWWTFRHNTFAVPQVRIQAERGQHVIAEGPYRFVRHPMYAAAIVFVLGTALLLGSGCGVLLVPVIALGIGIRALGEERMLRKGLAGYRDYARCVRYRLLPGIW